MTGRRVWWYFLSFFGVVAAVNAGMITLALRTHSGLVTDHPYEKGLAYNHIVAAEQAQESLGWSSSIAYANGTLHFTLRDADQRPITPDEATASFTRPTQQGMDVSVKLTGSETAIRLPARGVWDVRIDATHSGTPYQQSARITAP